MKKSLLVLALAAVLVLSFASTALAKNAGSEAVPDPYISWDRATQISSQFTGGVISDDQLDGPHASYTTNTVKCVVCHSVHSAPENTWLLTQVTTDEASADGNAAIVCSYCHGIGATASTKIVSVVQGEATSPHSSRCTGDTACHARSPHGVGVSEYPVLAKRLLNEDADALIATATIDGDIAADEFAATKVGDARARALATGYLCSSSGACHGDSAFAVAERGMNMTTNDGVRSGHPVYVAEGSFAGVGSYASQENSSTNEWSAPGASNTLQIAWAPATGCAKCHDLVDDRTGVAAFPHNARDIPNAALGTAPSTSDRLWMTKASDASLTDAERVTGVLTDGATLADGTCLKCHVAASGTEGVGQTY